jgi:hypothetical protein
VATNLAERCQALGVKPACILRIAASVAIEMPEESELNKVAVAGSSAVVITITRIAAMSNQAAKVSGSPRRGAKLGPS